MQECDLTTPKPRLRNDVSPQHHDEPASGGGDVPLRVNADQRQAYPHGRHRPLQ